MRAIHRKVNLGAGFVSKIFYFGLFYGSFCNFCSIKSFVEDSGDYLVRLVDGVLDSLTDGEHSKSLKKLNNVKKFRLDLNFYFYIFFLVSEEFRRCRASDRK